MKKFLHSFTEPQTVILWSTYWMYVLIFPALIALLINFRKVQKYKKHCVNGDVAGTEDGLPSTLFASHHDWQVRSFIMLMFLTMVSIGTLYSGFGILLAAFTAAFWLYRLARGMIALAAHKPMPGYYCSL